MAELPDEVYVITVDGEWPLTVVTHEGHAINAYENKVKDRLRSYGGDRRHAESKVRMSRCRLKVIEELEVLPPGRPKIVTKGAREAADV